LAFRLKVKPRFPPEGGTTNRLPHLADKV
jgi:hypothetical protein